MYEQHCEKHSSEDIAPNSESHRGYTGVTIRNADGKYFAEISHNGKMISGLSEAVGFRTLKKRVKDWCGIELPLLRNLAFQTNGCRHYANFNVEETE